MLQEKLLKISGHQELSRSRVQLRPGFFPYEWVDSLTKLEETSLPPHASFYSSLKNANITEDDYRYCQQVWEAKEMSTFKVILTKIASFLSKPC